MLRIAAVILLFPLFAFSQNRADARIDELKDTLATLEKSMSRGENDSVRNTAASAFQQLVEGILNDSTSFQAGFEPVKNISVKMAPDNSFRLYTWTYANNDASRYNYIGYLQTYNAKTKKTTLFALHDSSETIEKPQSVKLNSQRWYGAVYYNILKNIKDKKTYYTLLGWHGRNASFTQKLADVLYFDGGKPVFGYPLFKAGKVYHDRIIFQFDAQAVMSFHYDESRKMLVFDHIANLGGKNGPDGTYDAYRFDKGHWELLEDVDVNAGFKPKNVPKPYRMRR